MNAYDISCPSCGRTLEVVALHAACAPWLCRECAQGFWPSELAEEARRHWVPSLRSFRWPHCVRILAAVDQDRGRSAERRTSLLPEHAAHLPEPRRLAEADRLEAAGRAPDVVAALRGSH